MAAQAAVQISSPYFNPYMLGELRFSYSIYVIVVCAAIVAKIVFLPTVGRIADRMGVRRVFWISAAAIVPSPALWLVSNNCGYLIAVQIYSGMAWCAYDLATLLLFFETIPRQKRVDVLAYFNLANSAATAAGSLFGAGILATWGANRQAYLILFVLSALARATAIVLLLRIPARAAIQQVALVIPRPTSRALAGTIGSVRGKGAWHKGRVGRQLATVGRALRSPQTCKRLSGKAGDYAVGCGQVQRRPTNSQCSWWAQRFARPHPTAFRIASKRDRLERCPA